MKPKKFEPQFWQQKGHNRFLEHKGCIIFDKSTVQSAVCGRDYFGWNEWKQNTIRWMCGGNWNPKNVLKDGFLIYIFFHISLEYRIRIQFGAYLIERIYRFILFLEMSITVSSFRVGLEKNKKNDCINSLPFTRCARTCLKSCRMESINEVKVEGLSRIHFIYSCISLYSQSIK